MDIKTMRDMGVQHLGKAVNTCCSAVDHHSVGDALLTITYWKNYCVHEYV